MQIRMRGIGVEASLHRDGEAVPLYEPNDQWTLIQRLAFAMLLDYTGHQDLAQDLTVRFAIGFDRIFTHVIRTQWGLSPEEQAFNGQHFYSIKPGDEGAQEGFSNPCGLYRAFEDP